jgi:hypothetical protein
LGFISLNPAGHAVIHIDTEQSLEDHDTLVRLAIRRAGLTEPPSWLLSYCLTGLSVKELRDAQEEIIRRAKARFGSIHSILIDGVADFVVDVNDPKECSGFVANLHATAVEFDCPIIGVIHLNPGSDFKTRGHLGSQLERKAESNLRLERDGDAIVLWADKNRRAPIPKDRGPRFVWSDDAGTFVSTATAGEIRDDAKRTELRAEAEAVFTEAGRPSLSWKEFHVHLQQVASLKPGTARKRFTEMLEKSAIAKNAVGAYELAQSTS